MKAYFSRMRSAEALERRGRAVEAALTWAQAARLAPHTAARVEALTGLRRAAELAMHQEIYRANHDDGCSWRMLAHHTDLSWQALHRRYQRPPMRFRPPDVEDPWRRAQREWREGKLAPEAVLGP